MKNQYNFVKANSQNDNSKNHEQQPSDGALKISSPNGKTLSKIQNYFSIKTKLSAQETDRKIEHSNSQGQSLRAAEKSNSRQNWHLDKKQPNTSSVGQIDKKKANIFSLANNKSLKNKPVKSNPSPGPNESSNSPVAKGPLVAKLSSRQAIDQKMNSSAEFSARKLQIMHSNSRQMQLQMQPNQKQNSQQVDKITQLQTSPELAKCYDEIDQIYDYIRGLAPLPIQLRKIKSIDFEQLEREHRLQRQHQAELMNRLRPSGKTSVPMPLKSDSSSSEANGRLRLLGSKTTGVRAMAPLPIKVVTSSLSHAQRPNVKRVESLNLSATKTDAKTTPANLIISSPKRGQLFRLPRAHSTSTLNKTNDNLRAERQQTNCTPNDNSLPHRQPVQINSNSLNRLRTRLFKIEPQIQVNSQQPIGGNLNSLDLVENYVDDVETSNSSRSSSSTSKSSDLLSSKSCDSSKSQTTSASSSSSTSESSRRDQQNDKTLAKSKKTSSCAEKWTEKSHSDYENDSASLTTSHSAESYDDDKTLAKIATGESRTRVHSAQGSQQSSCVNRPAQDPTKCDDATNRQLDEEHIYEQIPAHKTILAQQKASAKPFNYPMAYAPNIATPLQVYPNLTVRDRSRKVLATGHQHLQTQQSSRLPPAYVKRQLAVRSQPPLNRPLNHRYRLSMGNLQLMPYLSQPLASGPFGHEQLNRSTSSSRVNRAPQLSPSQLIAQIQVPRAVSKRQQVSNSPVFVWNQRRSSETTPETNLSRARNSPRRLTAIGIEELRTPLSQQLVSAKTLHLAPSRVRDSPEAKFNSLPIAKQESRMDSSADKQTPLVPSRRLNSISDLHSFSSIDELDSASSSNDEPSNKSHSPLNKPNPEERNFISSSSFIKCYYGREDLNGKLSEDKKLEQSDRKGAKKSARKLLELIGLNTATNEGRKSAPESNSRSSSKMSASLQAKKSSTKTSRVPEEQNKLNHQVKSTVVGDFLNAEGPILIRDRRIAALKSDLIRHYQHPTIQVSKVPATGKTSARPPLVDVINSTNTTNSTSSYEAAIQNSRRSPAAATESQQATGKISKRSSTNAASNKHSTPMNLLIRVPKLSKQSHLLNRPLPRAPTSSSQPSQATNANVNGHLSSSANSARAARHKQLTNFAHSGAYTKVSSLTGQAAGRQVNSKPLVSIGMDQTSVSKASKSSDSAQGNRAIAGQQTQSSPTVTTYTSSGISSRLTSGTHLLSSGSSSLSRSTRANGKTPVGPSEASRTVGKSRTGQLSSDSVSNPLINGNHSHNQLEFIGQSEEFELMDEDYGDEREQSTGARIGSSPKLADKEKRVRSRSRDAMSSNLRLFDERFSSKSIEHQLSSSDDSLLESIELSGLIARNKRHLEPQRSG